MDKFAFWVATHRNLCKTVTWIFWISMMALYILIDVSIWIVMLVAFIGIFLFVMTIESAAAAATKKEIEVMNDQCDSYPLLNKTAALLQHKHGASTTIMLNINYCIALEDIGRSQEAFDRLNQINIDTPEAAYIPWKIAYYSALYDACKSLGKMDAAVIWFNKVVQNYNSMKDGKDKNRLTESIKLMHAEMELFNDNIPQALALLRFVQPSCLRQQVCHSMIYAKIMLKTGQTDEARQALEFVVQNGNTLSYVPTAKQMLETL